LRLARVLAYTARRHCPTWTLDLESVQPRETDLASPFGLQGHVWNTHKLELWADAVQAAPDGAAIALLDADLAILQPMDDIWDRPFDFAYTCKPKGSRFPLNGGVVFLRVSVETRALMNTWRALNRFYLEHPKELEVWRHLYGGLNQTALGMLLRESYPDLLIMRLPCLDWNCEDEHWARFDAARTRIVHFKGDLHRALFLRCKPAPEWRQLVSLWRGLETEAMRAEGVPA
jgi:hypothetical protein